MSTHYHSTLKCLNIEKLLDRHPLIVEPQTPVATVVERMSSSDGQQSPRHSCALVVVNAQLMGIFTQQDLMRLVVERLNLDTVKISEVMSHPVRVLAQTSDLNPFGILAFLNHHQIHHVPIVDNEGTLQGIVTQSQLFQIFDPSKMLEEMERLQHVSDLQQHELNEIHQHIQHIGQLPPTDTFDSQSLLVPANDNRENLSNLQSFPPRQTKKELQEQIQACQSAQMQLEQFFSVTPSLLCIAGLDGYFRKLNPSFSRILGYTNTELLSESFLHFVHPDDRPATLAEIERLGTGETSISFENRYRCKDGSYRWFSWNSKAIWAEQTIYAAANDITESKQLENTLRQERNFIEAVLDTVGALIIVLDGCGQIIRFNPACEITSGYTSHEILGQYIWDVLIAPEEKEAVQSVFHNLRQWQAPNCYENYWVCKDGTRRLISWSNTILTNDSEVVTFVIGTGIDITIQRQAEQSLIRQYEQGQLLTEITRKIRDSLEIEHILQTAVAEARKLLACDRVLIIQHNSDDIGRVVQESITPDTPFPSFLNLDVSGLGLLVDSYQTENPACICDDLQTAPCSLYTAQVLKHCKMRSCMEVAIHAGELFWGVIIASQHNQPRQWEPFEVDLLQKLADQIGVAISQAELLNELETRVQERTLQLTTINQTLGQEIQERIQVETALRESQKKLEDILNSADEAVISIDSQQRILMYNRGAEQVFGYSFQEVYNQPLDILVPEAFRQIHQQHVRNFSASGNHARQMAERSRDVFGQRKTGEIFPAEASISRIDTNNGILLTVMLRDITERRQSEIALLRSEEQLRLTTDAMPALICYINTDERYEFNNQTYEDWFGISIPELRDRNVQDVVGDEYYSQVKPYMDVALSGEKVSFEAEITTPNGKTRYVLAKYIPEIDEQGLVKGFFGLTSDISDRKATERLKDEFISVAGHELRTPLTSIHGSLKLLATDRLGTLNDKGKEIVKIALNNTERLTRLINDVLDLERIELGRITMIQQRCNLAKLMNQSAQAMTAMAEHHGVQLSVQSLDIDVWADPDHITQALTNLLSNAIKFSPYNSTVWIKAIERDSDTVIQVEDQGRGIPADKLDSIFDRFQQVDASDSRQKGGTGLGLAICKKIIEQHGGEIWAESVLGNGSRFFFTLPK